MPPKTRGGGKVGSRRSQRNQVLEVEKTVASPKKTVVSLKKTVASPKKRVDSPKKTVGVNKKTIAKKETSLKAATKKRRGRKKKLNVKEVTQEDVEVEDVTPSDDELEDITPSDHEVEDDKETGQAGNGKENEEEDANMENKEDEEEDANMENKEDEEEAANSEEEDEHIDKENEENEEEKEEAAVHMEEDGVSKDQENEIPSTEGNVLPEDEVKAKKRRGPTKMRKVAETPNQKVAVTFTDFGEHVGPGSVTLSSFLGPLVREHVPVTLTDWRRLDEVTKETMWEEIQGRFNVEEEWQKPVIFKQLGSLWRAGKSRLVTQVRAAKTAAERVDLKPSNIPSLQVWNSFVRSKTNKTFTEVSNKYRELRRNQIPHTTSRKGMLRLAYDMKEKSQDPSKISRTKVWIVGHTHADGRPVKPQFAETIDQIQSLDSQMGSSSEAENIREDVVSKILGRDKPGRVRGFGRGVTATKLAFLQCRDAKIANMASEIAELKGIVRELAGKKKSNCDTETSEAGAGFKGVRVQIVDWFDTESVVVGEGEICSDDPMYKIGRVPIGPNAVAVLVKSVLSSEASLWRPTADVFLLEEVVDSKIAWPINKVILDTNPTSSQDLSLPKEGEIRRCRIYDWTNEEEEVVAEGLLCSSNARELVNNIPLGPNAVSIEVVKVFKENAHLWRPTADMFVIGEAMNQKIAWPVLKFEVMATAIPSDATPSKKKAKKKAESPGSTSSTKGAKQKCILLDCSNSGRKVAEGRVASTDPKEVCHFVPLGPNASKVWVEVVKIGTAKVWRPNSEMENIGDAIGSFVAWPNDKLKFV